MKRQSKPKSVVQEKLILELYISGMTQKSMQAVENIKRLCNEFLDSAYQLEIIDLYKRPELAAEQQIVFSPSLIKRAPLPKKILIGTFSDAKKIIKGLGLTSKE